MRTAFLSFSLFYTVTVFAWVPYLEWFDGTHAVSYNINGKNAPVVTTALQMFSSDMQMATGMKAVASKDATIQIYELDTNKGIAGKLRKQGIPIDSISGRMDAYWLGIRDGRIVIVGNNGRGCAYGLLELSRMAGVSPWVWWADVVPERKASLCLPEAYETLQCPSVEYRGIFLNDEDWTLSPWAWRTFDPQDKFGLISAKAYKEVFKLLLRLRANMIWPAMHGISIPFYQVPGAKEVADSCGIVIGTSHCEPLMRNNVGEWDKKERGAYNYVTNKAGVQQYWTERLKEVGQSENFYTVGMRGIHDSGMEGVGSNKDDKTRWLQQVIDDQREMLKKYVNKDVTKIPQQFVPYKEVLAIMENGLKVPDDVMLTWCDDNFGYLTRLSDRQQQQREGGAGIYYHLSYWGAPHDYLWLCTTQPGLVYNEMREAWRHNARRMWIVNLHEPKVAAYPLELFFDMAWNIHSVQPTSHLSNWLCREFGREAGEKLVPVMQQYYRLTGMRRPEFMGWADTASPSVYGKGNMPVQDTEFSQTEMGNELARYLSCWQQTRRQLTDARRLVPERLRDAFFSHVEYQVLAAAAMAEKTLYAQQARSLVKRNYDASRWSRDSALYTACAKSQAAYQEIRRLTDYWNNDMGGGRWKHSMCFMPRDLQVFHAPRLPMLLTDVEVVQYSTSPSDVNLQLPHDGTFVSRNAAHYEQAGEGAEMIEMLGHSMQAVALPKGQTLTYRFTVERSDSCVLRTAVIPTQPNDRGDIRYAVSIDGSKERSVSFKVNYHSQQWSKHVLRGQAVAVSPLYLTKGEHTLSIRALDDHVVVDQWMIDFKPDRKFYLFPQEND